MGIVRKIKHFAFGKSGAEIIAELKQQGAEIGNHVVLFDPANVFIDSTRPYLLKIGSYTKITRGVVILTHDYSLSVLRRVYGEWIGEGGVTEIGENCFLGMNSVILMGSHIGNNVIVGAGSVVHGVVPDNVVVAGNPAKIVCTLEEHYIKRKERTVNECKTVVERFKKVYDKNPLPKDIGGFKFLFAPRDKTWIKENGLSFECSGDEPAEVEKAFYSSKPCCSYEELIE